MGFPEGASAVTQLIVVSDLERSTRWYVDVLGARMESTYGGTSTVLQLLGAWLLLVTEGEPSEDKPTVRMLPPSDPDTVSTEMIFRVADCRGAYETLRGRGAQFLTPPLDRGYEIRAFFRDPDGHLFEISEVGSSQ